MLKYNNFYRMYNESVPMEPDRNVLFMMDAGQMFVPETILLSYLKYCNLNGIRDSRYTSVCSKLDGVVPGFGLKELEGVQVGKCNY